MVSMKKYIKGFILANLRGTELRVENLPFAFVVCVCSFIVLRLCYPLKNAEVQYNLSRADCSSGCFMEKYYFFF